MICPNCGFDNLPGSEECGGCQQDLTQLDRPMAQDRIERSLMEDPVSLLQPRTPIMVRPTTTVQEAIRTMLTLNIGALLIVDSDGRLLGIFSERDLLLKVAGLHPSFVELPVAQFMTPEPETLTATDTLAFAIHKMDIGGYRHLPILKDGRPTGVISVRDLVRHITRICENYSLRDNSPPEKK